MITSTIIPRVSNRFLIGAGFFMMAFVMVATPSIASAYTLYRQLEIGSVGADVTALQTFLAQDRTIYPQGIVTGYFGSLTYSAVSNFQARNGIATVGRVGPITLAALNRQMGGVGEVVTGLDISGPTISSENVTKSSSSANFSWNTNEFTRGIVYYSNTPLMLYETLHDVYVTGSAVASDSTLSGSHNINVTGLQSNTTYYYMIHATDQRGNVSVTWPSTFRTD